LEREVIATERGARPLARVLGQGQYIDGRRSTEPDPAGQAAAMRAALSSAGAEAADIDYVNAHATGSTAGDVAEAAALSKVFGSHGRPLVNSTKAMIGHCLTGAGLQEIIATILQMNGEFVHPNPNLERSIAPTLALAPREAVPTRIELALSNSFAFSGINASVVLGRWPARRGDRP
jgi:malonyl-ACP decarboxylase